MYEIHTATGVFSHPSHAPNEPWHTSQRDEATWMAGEINAGVYGNVGHADVVEVCHDCGEAIGDASRAEVVRVMGIVPVRMIVHADTCMHPNDEIA